MILEKIYRNLNDGINNLNSAFGKENPLKPNLLITLTAEEAETLMNLLRSCDICKSTEMVEKELLDYLSGDDLENNYVKKNIASKLANFLLDSDKILFKKREYFTRSILCYDSYVLVGNVKEALKPMWKEDVT